MNVSDALSLDLQGEATRGRRTASLAAPDHVSVTKEVGMVHDFA